MPDAVRPEDRAEGVSTSVTQEIIRKQRDIQPNQESAAQWGSLGPKEQVYPPRGEPGNAGARASAVAPTKTPGVGPSPAGTYVR